MWERIHIDAGAWRQSKEKVGALKIVQQAVLKRKKLRIHYEQLNGEQKERLVEPLGLVAKGSNWYLVALRNGELRNYRVSRIHHAKVEEKAFDRPQGFNLAVYWEQSKAEFIQSLPKYDVQVEVDPEIMKRLRFTGKFVQVIETEHQRDGQWIAATVRFHNEQEAIEFLIGFGNKLKVISPKDLPNKIVALAKSVIDYYQGAK